MFDLVTFIPRAVAQGIPLLLGSTGEIVTEKSGNLNLGIPGVMYVGGICGVIGSFLYEGSLADPSQMNALLGVLIPLVCCLLGSLAGKAGAPGQMLSQRCLYFKNFLILSKF